MQEIYGYSVLGNTILSYLTALAVFIGVMALVYEFKRYVLSRLKIWAESTATSFDDLLINAIDKSLVPFFYIGAFYIALHTLVLSTEFRSGMRIAAIVLLTALAVRAVTSAVNFGLRSHLKKADNLERGEEQLKGIRGLINIAIWAIALVFLLDNLGVKISAVVAGLGIGGVAVALAAQAV
jgi:small-conductance mechanosensitive channel